MPIMLLRVIIEIDEPAKYSVAGIASNPLRQTTDKPKEKRTFPAFWHRQTTVPAMQANMIVERFT